MYKRVLIALDLEGVNNVVGEPYNGLARDTEQWQVARAQAVLEVNAAAEALFDAGCEKVGLWDNHGGGGNVDVALLDKRITFIDVDLKRPRMYFAEGEYDCICYFGYHAMEGTLGGVLAHTMNSKAIQYYKLNGSYIGEVDMDGYIAAEHGMPSVFFAGGNIACAQAKRAIPYIETTETKTELSRNEAIFRDNGELLRDIKAKIVKAVSAEQTALTLKYPAVMEKSFKRVEDAASYFKRLLDNGFSPRYLDDGILGKDAHTVLSTVNNIGEFIKSI